MGGKLYVVGGALADGTRTALVQIYDYEKGEWSRGADMPKAREGAAIEGKGLIYVPGGYDGTRAIRDFYAYDPANDQWTELPSLPAKLSAHHGVVSKGKLYVFGDYEILDRTAVHDLKTGKWELVDLNYKPVRHHGAAVAGGKIWVVGGNVSPVAPFYDYVQSYTQEELEAAPRRPWEPEKEKAPQIPGRSGQAAVAASPLAAPKGPARLLEEYELAGKPAPALEMPLFGGGAFRLADHAGKLVVLDFWSMSCPPCVRALPEVAALAKEFAGKGVVFAGVNLDPPSRREQVEKFLKARDVPMSTGYGAGNDGRAYEVKGIPCIVVIGGDGRVKGRLVGFGSGSKDRLKKAIETLLRGEEDVRLDESLERLLQGEEVADAPAPVAAGTEAKASAASKNVRSRSAVRTGPVPDPRVFRLKWRRPLEGQYRMPRASSEVEWRIPPRHWVAAEENGLELYSAADGRLVKTLELPGDAGGKQEAFAFMYLRNGAGGTFIGSRRVSERTEIGPGSYAYRSIGMGWIGISTEGTVVWERLEEEPQATIRECHALPVGPEKDLLAVLSWMRFSIQDEKGNTLAKRDFSATDERWIFRPAADGSGSEALLIGADVACYEVMMPPSSELPIDRFEPVWNRSGSGYKAARTAEGRVVLGLSPRFMVGIENGQAVVLAAATGEERGRSKMRDEWTKGKGETLLEYLRSGPKGLVVAARAAKPFAGGETDAAMLSIAGLNEDGTERWRHDFAERLPDLRIAALPERDGRDLLMAQLWDRLVFIDAEGRILLEQPLGITAATWVIRESPDGKSFEIVETLDGTAVYRWKQGLGK